MSIKSVYTEITYYLCYILPFSWMHRLVPIERFIIPVNKTKREWYVIERNVYRLGFALQNRGDILPRRQYFHYKLIAEKYNLPYIKELYDD